LLACVFDLVFNYWLRFLSISRFVYFKIGSGCRTACGSLNLKPYSTAFCNMTVTHDESAVGLVKCKR